MHAVSIQEVTSLADSYDLPIICTDLQVSIMQSMGYLKHVEHLYSSHLGDRGNWLLQRGDSWWEERGEIWHLFLGGGGVQHFIFCKSAYQKQ